MSGAKISPLISDSKGLLRQLPERKLPRVSVFSPMLTRRGNSGLSGPHIRYFWKVNTPNEI